MCWLGTAGVTAADGMMDVVMDVLEILLVIFLVEILMIVHWHRNSLSKHMRQILLGCKRSSPSACSLYRLRTSWHALNRTFQGSMRVANDTAVYCCCAFECASYSFSSSMIFRFSFLLKEHSTCSLNQR